MEINKLRPFNLEAAKDGAKVVTRNGRPARIVCFDRKSNASIIALITNKNNKEELFTYHKDGTCGISEYDLMMAPTHYEGWVNIIPLDDYIVNGITSNIYRTEEIAKKQACDATIATVKVEWDEY